MIKLQVLHRIEWLLLISVALLLGVGLVILNAITIKEGVVAPEFSPLRQAFFALLGIGALIAVARIDSRLWYRLAPAVYWIGLLLLLGVLVAGKSALGATRWIDIGFFQFQPSEFIKLGLVLVLARFLSKHYEQLRQVRYFVMSLAIAALPMALVMLQPDLGSALVLGFIWLVMILSSSTRKWYVAALAVFGLLLLPVVVSNLHDYQRKRLETFLDPAADPQGAGYNVAQATIAVGSGRLLGRGLTSGSQSQLNFLPSQHTDFIFAVLAEKLGFTGAGLVLLLFMALLFRILRIAWKAEEHFSFFVAMGLFAMFMMHILVNIGMNLQLLPVTGIPLPFLSYGGTNLIVSLIAIGLLEGIVLHRKELAF